MDLGYDLVYIHLLPVDADKIVDVDIKATEILTQVLQSVNIDAKIPTGKVMLFGEGKLGMSWTFVGDDTVKFDNNKLHTAFNNYSLKVESADWCLRQNSVYYYGAVCSR